MVAGNFDMHAHNKDAKAGHWQEVINILMNYTDMTIKKTNFQHQILWKFYTYSYDTGQSCPI